VALRVDPRVEVVGDQREREARLLGQPGVPNEVGGRVLLRRQRIAELRHGGPVTPDDLTETEFATPP
jgi:hypothetical protein